MQSDPKSRVIQGETEPLRDAADFMMDAIAGHFSHSGDLPLPAPAPERRRSLVRTLLLSALGVLAVAAVLTYARSQFVVLPDYTGAHETQAEGALLNAGLAVTLRAQSSTLVLAHHVIEQAPAAGRWLMKGATVVLTTSSGLPRVAVRHDRSAAKPKLHAPSATLKSPRAGVAVPRARAVAPRTAHSPSRVHHPEAIAAATPYGVHSVGGVHLFRSHACAADNLAVEIRGFPTGCTAFAIASTGKLLHDAGSGLVVPVTVIDHPGEAMYGLMYVTAPTAAFRRFFGVLVGNGTGHLIVSVRNGQFEAQNGSHARYESVVAATPAPVEAAADTHAAHKTNCPQRTWLQRTWQHVFAPRSIACQ